jgi:hypothetical protein
LLLLLISIIAAVFNDKVTFYTIVCKKEGLVWETKRRYSVSDCRRRRCCRCYCCCKSHGSQEFYALYEAVIGQSNFKMETTFPPKIPSLSNLAAVTRRLVRLAR